LWDSCFWCLFVCWVHHKSSAYLMPLFLLIFFSNETNLSTEVAKQVKESLVFIYWQISFSPLATNFSWWLNNRKLYLKIRHVLKM
jgi:hypothetical protein